MYPLLLKPAFKDYIWGGTKLKSIYGFENDAEKMAEAWMLSCHKDGENIVKNGTFAGKRLSEVLEVWGKEALGARAAEFSYFPLLIKFIDAKDSLSVQVHPDDEYALKNECEYGKTEMWYIVDCEEGAELIYGFNRSVDKAEFARRIKDNTLMEVCNYVPVKKGDVFFIDSGTLHAIGKGILIAEIQQNSNSTYRVFDFGRLGADGKPRELHIDKALAVTKTEKPKIEYGNTGSVEKYPFGTVRELASCDLFKTQLLSLDGKVGLFEEDSFISLLILDGSVTLSYAGGNMHAEKGDSIFIPSNMRVALNGAAEIICSGV